MLQNTFGVATVAYLCLGATGSGLAGIAAFSYIHSGARIAFSLKASMWLSWACLVLGSICLLLDSGKPLQTLSLFSFANLESWATRGFWLLFMSIAIYALLLVVISKSSSRVIGIYWGFYKRHRDIFAKVLSWLTLVCSIFLSLYTGFLLYESLGVPFWRTLLLPILFICGSANIGLNFFLWIRALHPSSHKARFLLREKKYREVFHCQVAMLSILMAEAILLTLYLVWASDNYFDAAELSFNHLVWGEYSLLFWLGGVCAGLCIPFLVTFIQILLPAKRHKPTLTTFTLLSAVIGLTAVRFGIVFSGISLY